MSQKAVTIPRVFNNSDSEDFATWEDRSMQLAYPLPLSGPIMVAIVEERGWENQNGTNGARQQTWLSAPKSFFDCKKRTRINELVNEWRAAVEMYSPVTALAGVDSIDKAVMSAVGELPIPLGSSDVVGELSGHLGTALAQSRRRIRAQHEAGRKEQIEALLKQIRKVLNYPKDWQDILPA